MKHRKGQSLVEFVIVLPILVAIILAVIELGKIYSYYTKAQAASRYAVFRDARNPEDKIKKEAIVSKFFSGVPYGTNYITDDPEGDMGVNSLDYLKQENVNILIEVFNFLNSTQYRRFTVVYPIEKEFSPVEQLLEMFQESEGTGTSPKELEIGLDGGVYMDGDPWGEDKKLPIMAGIALYAAAKAIKELKGDTGGFNEQDFSDSIKDGGIGGAAGQLGSLATQ